MSIHYIPKSLDRRVVIRVLENLGWKRLRGSKKPRGQDVMVNGTLSFPIPMKRAKKTRTISLVTDLGRLGTTENDVIEALCTPRSISR